MFNKIIFFTKSSRILLLFFITMSLISCQLADKFFKRTSEVQLERLGREVEFSRKTIREFQIRLEILDLTEELKIKLAATLVSTKREDKAKKRARARINAKRDLYNFMLKKAKKRLQYDLKNLEDYRKKLNKYPKEVAKIVMY